MAATPLGVTFGSLGVLGPKAVTDIAISAQGLGYKSFWTVEANGTDAMSLLGAVSHAAPKLDLATGIIPIQLQNASPDRHDRDNLAGTKPGC